ncbi:MAG: CoB--CoM heterodisulfide reductase iron-sulfur subunit B family protein [Bacillota bacterium]
MRYSYYPGCTLKTQAGASLERPALQAARALGIDLVEQEEWQCCGAVFPLATDEIAPFLAAVRSLATARDRGEKLVTLCAACHHVLKRTNHLLQVGSETRDKTNNYLQLEQPYTGEGQVIHYLELLRDELGFDRVAQKVTHPLAGRRIAPYYGCLLLRPAKIMAFDNAEDPRVMEDLLLSLGAEPVDYPYRTECCGVYLSVNNEEIAGSMVRKIVHAALKQGAEAMVNACPLCHYNLLNLQEKTPGGEPLLPVYYFTELLVTALGLPEEVGDKTR